VARKIGDVQSRVVLSLFYFLIAMPFAMAVRLTTDPLGVKANAPHGWRQRVEQDGTPQERARRQF